MNKKKKRDNLLSKLWKKYGESLNYKVEASIQKRSKPKKHKKIKEYK